MAIFRHCGTYPQNHMQEAIVWRQLDHPNLVPFIGLYYLNDTMKRLCLVSPWMERGNLVEFMRESPELVDPSILVTIFRISQYSTERWAFEQAYDVASGLSHLHNMKIIHGDLKGVNIMITRDLKASIGDFGLSRVSDTQRLFSLQSNHSRGTTRWLAPELLRHGPDCVATRESDVYAYACVCYEIFTGRLPFYELSDPAVICTVLIDGNHPARPDSLPGLRDAMWNMMVQCWEAAPSRRPTMVKVLAVLRRILSDDTVSWDSESDSGPESGSGSDLNLDLFGVDLD
ncbi:hypothetical protein PM082_014472 [Marasmius tenuissimus]|nr:hypothetical protein PM082_014472 [Marasmius tenuissimus]